MMKEVEVDSWEEPSNELGPKSEGGEEWALQIRSGATQPFLSWRL